MNPNDDNNFIVPDTEEATTEAATSDIQNENKFTILPHLLILGFILFGIFGTVIVPKTLSYLGKTNEVITEIKVPEVASLITPVSEIESLPIRAKSAYVYDVTTGSVLFKKGEEQVLPLASITKLMTALVAYELLDTDTIVTISSSAASQQSGGTLMAGEKFKVKELADFALVTSYNSAAYMLASSVGELLGDADPETQFVAGMNLKAAEIGLNSLNFSNPTGLDISTTKAGAYGSAKDVSMLVTYIYQNYPEILRPTIAKSTRLYNTAGDYHEADNTNEIISSIPNLLGSKTGYTDLAGGNLTVIFDAGFNRPIVITVLGSTHSERFSDVKKLIAASIAAINQK